MANWPANEIWDVIRKHPHILREMGDPDADRGLLVVTMPGYCWGDPKKHTVYVKSAQELELSLYVVRPCRCALCQSQGNPATIARGLLNTAGARLSPPELPEEVTYNLRELLIKTLFWMEEELAGLDVDPQHPAWYETLLARLRDAIDHRLAKHTWAPYANRVANAGVILDQPEETGQNYQPREE